MGLEEIGGTRCNGAAWLSRGSAVWTLNFKSIIACTPSRSNLVRQRHVHTDHRFCHPVVLNEFNDH